MRIRSIHPFSFFLFTAVIAVLAGCSLKTVYNRLDRLIPPHVEGLVTLDDVLKQEIELRSQVLVSRYRNTQLIQYADWLRALQRNECLNGEVFETLLEAPVLIDRWRHEYNTFRPHSSLVYRPPAPEARILTSDLRKIA